MQKDLQNDVAYLDEFYQRKDIQELDAISRQLKYLDDRMAVKLAYVPIRTKDGVFMKPVIEYIMGTYPYYMEVINKWNARKATESKVKV